jgi:2-polyprenyl-6-methoxyphenol hydroxylase-like FAD-dependent oxidoreductase
MRVVIVGASIGGLSLALSLHKRGLPCRVYEPAPGVGKIIGMLLHDSRAPGGPPFMTLPPIGCMQYS